ncbi:hypothetical protein [Specibacter sp. NPDC078692]|uniref:hypothetical protein n=1 Tax=Specibacter sp. NPDC078692 TaxID=3155818 RepID=UPI0034233F51
MPAKVISGLTSYGDTTRPRINLSYTRPLAGAVVDFAADNLPLGPLPVWYDLINGLAAPTRANYTQPTVVDDGANGRVVRFNGTSDAMLAKVVTPQPMTMVLVGRIRVLNPTTYLKTGGATLGTNSTSNWLAFAGTGGAYGPPGLLANTNQHILVASFNGNSSALSVDGNDRAGQAAGTNGSSLIGFGTDPNSTAFMAIDINRFAILPYAATQAQRDALYQTLAARYGS